MKRREILKGLSILPLVASSGAVVGKQLLSENPTDKVNSDEWFPKKELIKTAAGSCIRSGNLLFIGGIGGWYARQRTEPGDIKVQIRSSYSQNSTIKISQ